MGLKYAKNALVPPPHSLPHSASILAPSALSFRGPPNVKSWLCPCPDPQPILDGLVVKSQPCPQLVSPILADWDSVLKTVNQHVFGALRATMCFSLLRFPEA